MIVDLAAIRAQTSDTLIDSIIAQDGACRGVNCVGYEDEGVPLPPCPLRILRTTLGKNDCSDGIKAYYGMDGHTDDIEYTTAKVRFCQELKGASPGLVIGDAYSSIFSAMRG
jgi:hypothetical protein